MALAPSQNVTQSSENGKSRKMNAVYAKRCYYKRKLEVIELEHNVKALREQNEKLNVESQWLQ